MRTVLLRNHHGMELQEKALEKFLYAISGGNMLDFMKRKPVHHHCWRYILTLGVAFNTPELPTRTCEPQTHGVCEPACPCKCRLSFAHDEQPRHCFGYRVTGVDSLAFPPFMISMAKRGILLSLAAREALQTHRWHAG